MPFIAVALVSDASGGLLITWHAKWRSFTFPMTQIAHDQLPAKETPIDAAVRAAANVLQVPCRVVAGKEPSFRRGLQLSGRDAEIKDYHYHIFDVEPHPDFADRAVQGLYASTDKLRDEDYQPISDSVKEILKPSDAN